MRVFSKKRYTFIKPTGKSLSLQDAKDLEKNLVEVYPNQFATIPGWCQEDIMFGWAVSDGDIEVIPTGEKEAIDVEFEEDDESAEELAKAEKVLAFDDLKAKELFKLCSDNGIECEAKKSRKHYIELLLENGVEAPAAEVTEE